MAKESVLTNAQKESILIKKFIFHIIIREELNPQFLDEVELTIEQLEFSRNALLRQQREHSFYLMTQKLQKFIKTVKP